MKVWRFDIGVASLSCEGTEAWSRTVGEQSREHEGYVAMEACCMYACANR